MNAGINTEEGIKKDFTDFNYLEKSQTSSREKIPIKYC